MTDPGYLEQAAAELANAREVNEKRWERAAQVRDADPHGADALEAEAAARSMEIAEGYTRLAAIEAGLPPCHHPLQPGQEQP